MSEKRNKEFYIDYLDRVLKAWMDDDVRSVEEFYEEFYSELHPELDVDKECDFNEEAFNNH